METLRLYHTGFERIPAPDLKIGRKNADFGQGFYLSDDAAFSVRWARTRKGMDTWHNAYELTLDGLRVLRLDRDEAWFDYIYNNRNGAADLYPDYDVIIGPIANDTVYDTLGVTTGGLLPRAYALRLLLLGPKYRQIVLKTEAAAAKLRFLSARILPPEEIEGYRRTVKAEEAAYQELFGAEAEKILAEMEQAEKEKQP